MKNQAEATPVGDPGGTNNNGPETDPTAEEKNMTQQVAAAAEETPPLVSIEGEGDEPESGEDEEEGSSDDEAIAAKQLAAAVEGPLLSPVPGEQKAVVLPETKVEEAPAAAHAPRRAVGARMPSDDDVPAPKKVAEAPPAPKQVVEAAPAKVAIVKPVYAGAAAPAAKPAVASPPPKADSDPPPSIKVGRASVAVGAATMAAIEADVSDERTKIPGATKVPDTKWASVSKPASTSGSHRTPPEVLAAQMNAGKKDVRDDGDEREPDPPAAPQRSRFDDEIHGDNVEDIDKKKPPVAKPVARAAPPPTTTAAAIEAAGLKKQKWPLIQVIMGCALLFAVGMLVYQMFKTDKRNAPSVTGTSAAGQVAATTGNATAPATAASESGCTLEPMTPANLTKYFGENDPADFRSTVPLDKSKPYLKCGKGQAKRSAHGYNVSACKICIPPE